MDALVLAAGKGTRLRPLTDQKPKVLVEVKGKSLIEHIIDDLKEIGAKQITVVKGYMGEMLEERLDKYENIDFIQQEKQLGTAHAIGLSSFSSPFLTVNGDVFMHRRNLRNLVSAFGEDTEAVIGSMRVENPEEFGVLEVKGREVKDIIEKPDEPPSDIINTGTYVFSPEIYKYIKRTEVSERGEYEITDSLRMMLKDGKPVSHAKFSDYWIDVGRHEDLARAKNIETKDKTKRSVVSVG
ncbi:MAG: sugar phosphate nucleotidyltransferase [Candidatus Aenigmatarchaeota archaeon]